ncbi:MAG: glycosyltransferase, partial [Bacteroidia bacterium]
MEKNYFVSVCIPAYNQTEFLRKTFDSLVKQSYKTFEVVLTDDSTTSDVRLLTEKFKDRLQINYYKNPVSLGSPANWNKAIDLAKGELIKFIHHDDWLASETSLEEFVKVFQDKPGLQFAFCDSEILNVGESKKIFNIPPNSFLESLKRDPRVLFNDNRIGSPTATMFRKNELRFDEKVKYVVDLEFYMRYLQLNSSFEYIHKALIVNTSNHPGQVTAISHNKKTQIGEYCYLYNKVYKGKIPGRELSLFFVRLFRSYTIKTLKEVKEFGEV